MPHLFSQLLELPLPPDFLVDCFESDSAFEFVARGAFKGASATKDGEARGVITKVVDIMPSGAKKVVMRELNAKRTRRSAENNKGTERSAQDEEEENKIRTTRSAEDEEEESQKWRRRFAQDGEEEEKWRFWLPQLAKLDAAIARFENGVLRVVIPRFNDLCAVSSADQSQTGVLLPLPSPTPQKQPSCCGSRAVGVF